MKRYKFLISGRVQGVGFRYFVYTKATLLGVGGYVKNLDDGRVLVEVEGESEKVFELLAQIYKGNGFSIVDDVEREELEPKGDKKFNILY